MFVISLFVLLSFYFWHCIVVLRFTAPDCPLGIFKLLFTVPIQGRIQDFKLGGGVLKKFVGVFRVKNHDFTPKNHIFSNCRGRREHYWGISCEKSRFYAKKSYCFPILGGALAGCAPPCIRP